MSDWRLVHISEPALAFGFGQTAEHPKDGLFLFGPPVRTRILHEWTSALLERPRESGGMKDG